MSNKPTSSDGQDVAAAHRHALSVRVERKHFTLSLGENPRGRFLRITEEAGDRFDSIVVPLSGLEQFRDALDAAIKSATIASANPKTAVLVVDDNPVDQELAAIQIKKTQPFNRVLEIDFAADGREALDKMRHKQFALIVLDWKLPVMGEGAVLRQLRQQGLHTPVVVVSGQEQNALGTDLAVLEAAFLNKDGMSPDNLHRAIDQSLALVGTAARRVNHLTECVGKHAAGA